MDNLARLCVVETKVAHHENELRQHSQTLSTMQDILCKQAEMTQQITNTNEKFTDLSHTVKSIGAEVHLIRSIVLKGVGGLTVGVALPGLIYSITRFLP